MFRYEIKAPEDKFCEAQELLLDPTCRGYTLRCPDHIFKFNAQFTEEIDQKTLDYYKKLGFSIKKL